MAKATAKKTDETLPGRDELEKLLAPVGVFAGAEKFRHVRRNMLALCNDPPQSLLIEGGSADERLAAALYWAALLNCESTCENGDDASGPCLHCGECLRLIGRMHRDLYFFDGLESSIKIDEVREMRAVLGEPPRESRSRIILFREAQALGEAAANALLKSLEEPRPGNAFMLLVPQRQRLLPTLVSRSWVMTLPWPEGAAVGYALGVLDQGVCTERGAPEACTRSDEDSAVLVEWVKALLQHLRSGRGWMDRTGRKGSVDATLANRLLLFCQSALLAAYSGAVGPDKANPLASAFAELSPQQQRICNEVLAECQDSLVATVNPALVLDWMATRLYFLYRH